MHAHGLRRTNEIGELGAFAAAHGVDEPTFQALPVAGRYAWDWARFNAAALREAEVLPNVRIVVYEDLCRDPIGQTRALFEFVGLNWHRQTETFLRSSTTHEGPSGYYAVFRNSAEAAEKWRTTMDPADQEAVRSVVRRFPVARYWGDLGE